jgi:O-antigen/teichoic acid export membrane protein
VLVYLDRFVIGSLLSVAWVAYYATPYEMVTKLLIVPGAIMSVLFPAFASTHRHNREEMVQLFRRGASYVTLLLFPVVLLVVTFADEGLRLWLGADFALHGAPVLRWLAVGVFLNAVAQVTFTLIQGVGRPDLSAKLHLIELPLYVPLLWFAISRYGILGAALAWTARVALDGVMLCWVAYRSIRELGDVLRRLAIGLVGALAALWVPLLATHVVPRAAIAVVVLLVYAWVAWTLVLAPGERATLLRTWILRPARA